MKPRVAHRPTAALTLLEVLVAIFVLAVLVAMFLPYHDGRSKHIAMKIACVNNLKQIGLSYRLWPAGQSDKYPMQVAIKYGGAMELVATGGVALNYLVMSNQLSTPQILVCPADDRRMAATNFSTDFSDGKISYFVGVDAAEEYPQRLISGDDNFEIGGVPVKSGLLELSTNTPITWSADRHRFSGNIALADGSVQSVTISGLRSRLNQTGLATNRLAIP